MIELSKECVKRIRRMTKAILAQPEFYNQSRYPDSRDCGTTCCAAGWAVWLDNPVRYEKKVKEMDRDSSWVLEARKSLLLDDISPWNLPSLFSSAATWPDKFFEKYWKAQDENDHKGMAQACHDRWEYFIKTGK